MKIVCEKEKLLKGINSVVRGVPTRTTMPILEGILIQTNDNELKLTVTASTYRTYIYALNQNFYNYVRTCKQHICSFS